MPPETLLAHEASRIQIEPLQGIYSEPFSFGKLLRLTRFFGPAAILTSLSLGAGETIMVTGLGAWAGYQLLWLLLLSVVVKAVFVTYLIGRYTAITGQSISHRLVMLPGPRGWVLLAVVLAELGALSMGLTTVAKPCGNLIAYLHVEPFNLGLAFPIWENFWTILLMALALLVSQLSSFRSLERQQIIICGLLVAGTLLAVVLVKPDLAELVLGAIRFGQMPPAPDWAPWAARHEYVLNLVTVFSYVGGGLSGYLAYSNWISLRGWGLNSHPQIEQIRARANSNPRIEYLSEDPEQVRRLRVLYSPLHWDVGLGAVVLFMVTAAFMSSGAAVLLPQQKAIGGNEWQLLTTQAAIWRQVHAGLVPLYYVAIVLALWGTLASVPEAITRVTHDFLSAIWPGMATFPVRRLQLFLVSWFFVATSYWTVSGVSFALLTQVASFITLNVALSGVFLCTIYFNATLPRPYRPSPWVLMGAVASAVILLVCTCGSAIGLVRKWMN